MSFENYVGASSLASSTSSSPVIKKEPKTTNNSNQYQVSSWHDDYVDDDRIMIHESALRGYGSQHNKKKVIKEIIDLIENARQITGMSPALKTLFTRLVQFEQDQQRQNRNDVTSIINLQVQIESKNEKNDVVERCMKRVLDGFLVDDRFMLFREKMENTLFPQNTDQKEKEKTRDDFAIELMNDIWNKYLSDNGKTDFIHTKMDRHQEFMSDEKVVKLVDDMFFGRRGLNVDPDKEVKLLGELIDKLQKKKIELARQEAIRKAERAAIEQRVLDRQTIAEDQQTQSTPENIERTEKALRKLRN
jgi:hypothetical protein